MARLVFLWGIALSLSGQPAGDDLPARVRSQVAQQLSRLSNYMCTETVERTVYVGLQTAAKAQSCSETGPRRALYSDRLRLDVGVLKSGEMYSWAGESEFRNLALADLVRRGVISNGNYASLLDMVFALDPVRFSYRGEASDSGGSLSEFAFELLAGNTHYSFTRGSCVGAAYQGVVLIDPRTANPVRLRIQTVELPPETAACQATTELDYALVRVNERDLLLPSLTRLVIVNRDGSKSVNQTAFSGCREFLGESVVSYGLAERENSLQEADRASSEIRLSSGRPFEVTFVQDIDTAKAAVGDLVSGRLATPLQDRGRVVAPAGTPVTARIIELSHVYGSRPATWIGFRLEGFGNSTDLRRFAAHADSANRAKTGQQPPGKELWVEAERQAMLVFRDPDNNLVLKSGLKTKWITGR
jgi:hypothetical protein